MIKILLGFLVFLKFFFLFLGFMYELVGASNIYNLGQKGNVYDIAERDFYDVLQERISRVDKEKLQSYIKDRIVSYFRVNIEYVLPAVEDRVRFIQPVFKLPFDIVDHRGNVLYRSGLTYNVLDYVQFRNKLVFIDFTRPEEVEWLKKTPFYNDPNTVIIVVRGDLVKISESFDKLVYKADPFILKYFHIERTPSVVEPYMNNFVVKEIKVEKKDGKNK